MGRLTQLLTLSSLSLVAGVALGQTGLIVEPWRSAAPRPPAIVPRPMPASGLPPADPVAPRALDPRPSGASARRSEAAHAWSPPVVELLVDPWADAPIAQPAAPRGWLPRAREIIDPWAGADSPVPQVAARRSGPAPSTIF